MAGIIYKKNRFFIETYANSIFQDEFLTGHRLSTLIGFSGFFAEKKDIEEQIAINHELNHIVQDLSIPACIVEGEFKDTIKAYLAIMSNINGIRFPFDNEQNRLWNESLSQVNDKERNAIKVVYYLYDLYSYFFVQSFYKPEAPEFKINSQTEDFYYLYNLSMTDLLETYAQHKSYWEQFLRVKDGSQSNKMLHLITKEANLFPYQLSDDGIIINTKLLKFQKPYHIVLAMLIVLNRLNSKKLVDYYENEIPDHFITSEAYLMMRLMLCVLETALCIPSMEDILDGLSKDTYSLYDYSPVHRFYRILNNLYESDLPDLVEGEDYFITFHNWISAKNGWMDYNSTIVSVFSSLYPRAEQGKEVISNYQMTAISYKLEHFTTTTFVFPIEILRQINMPLMIKVSDKLVSLFYLGNHIKNETGLLRFYDLYFNPMDIDFNKGIIDYQTISDKLPKDENIKRILNNALGAQREIVIRVLAYETLQAFAKRGHFSCPMRDDLCPHGCDKCSSFRSFRDIVPICNKSIYRGPTKKEMRDDNTGNSIDCMLFDYLLDYGFNPLALE